MGWGEISSDAVRLRVGVGEISSDAVRLRVGWGEISSDAVRLRLGWGEIIYCEYSNAVLESCIISDECMGSEIQGAHTKYFNSKM